MPLAPPPLAGVVSIEESRLGNPQGLDSEDGVTFKQTAALVNNLRAASPQAKLLFETTPLHYKLKRKGVAQKQNDLMPQGITFKHLLASTTGASQRRERKIATDITNVEQIAETKPMSLDKVLHPTAAPIDHDPLLPAVLTTPHTHHPVVVYNKALTD